MYKSNSQNAVAGAGNGIGGPVSGAPARPAETIDRARLNVDRYADIGASCPDLRKRYDVDIREFVVLACLCNAGPAGVDALAEFIHLSHTSTWACLESLEKNHLVRLHDPERRSYTATVDGTALVRKAHCYGTGDHEHGRSVPGALVQNLRYGLT